MDEKKRLKICPRKLLPYISTMKQAQQTPAQYEANQKRMILRAAIGPRDRNELTGLIQAAHMNADPECGFVRVVLWEMLEEISSPEYVAKLERQMFGDF